MLWSFRVPDQKVQHFERGCAAGFRMLLAEPHNSPLNRDRQNGNHKKVPAAPFSAIPLLSSNTSAIRWAPRTLSPAGPIADTSTHSLSALPPAALRSFITYEISPACCTQFGAPVVVVPSTPHGLKLVKFLRIPLRTPKVIQGAGRERAAAATDVKMPLDE